MEQFIDWLKDSIKSESETKQLGEKLKVTPLSKVKHVYKPWGFELWLSDATDLPFALKIIHLKAGSKTSLQYHDKKKESNCLIAGEIKLHYEDPETKKITSVKLGAGEVIQVLPPAIHRVEALTDVVLVEASTSELDDVVRLQDDYERPDGKIETEHKTSL